MADYLIPAPSVENAVNTGYKGTLIYSETDYRRNYYVLQKDTENAWWAIGMIAKVGRYDHPIIVSDQRKNVHTICDGGGGQSSAEYEMTYDGVTYYVSGYTPYATDTVSGSRLKNNIIPYYNESTFSDTEAGYKSAGKKLLDLYIGTGGSLTGAKTYQTSWVRKLINNVWTKTFAFAHAKTVYTDFANKKTLADKLSEIDTSLDGKANLSHTHTKSQITDFPTLGTASAKDVASSGNASTTQVVMGNDTRLTDARKASDVSAWAKASSKPSYTASEVGAYTKEETDTKLNDKANSSHTHGNGDITSLDASKITSGTISIDRLPQGALERLTIVADDTARFKLTSSTVQKGDTVKVTATGKMYYIVDETKLSSEAGYEVYAAGTAASVPWSGVTDKPSTYTPSSHTHIMEDVSDWGDYVYSAQIDRTKNTVLAAPNGSNGKASFRTLVEDDIPVLSKSKVGLENVDNTADADKSVKSSTKLETYKVDSTTETYGDNYPVYAQWRDSSHVKLKCDNYTVETDYATNAGSAANASKVNNHTVEANVPANAKFTDTNTWRGIQDNLTSDSTTDSLSANQGKILNDSKLMHETITTNKLDINTLTKTGIYHIKTTTCLNVPTNNHATLFVDNIVGTPYQIFMPDALTTCMYKRTYIGNDTWTSWTELKFTDTDTWRGIQNNLTSDSTTDSLSAAQGKVLKGLVDGKAASGHTHSSVSDIVSGSSTTFAYSKSGLDYGNYTWLAGWNGYELRAVNKSQFLASSGGTLTGAVTMNAALTFGKNDSYGIFPNTTNYGSIGSSSKYFYQSFITNMSVEALKRKSATSSIGGNTEPFNKIYVKNIIVPDKFYLRPSSTTSSDVEYTDVDRSVWLHGFDGSSVNGKQSPGLLLRQGSSFYQIFPSDGLSGSAATDIGHTQYKFRNIVGKNLFSDSGTVSTSDRNLKHDIQDLTDDTVEQLIDGISPKSFKFNDGTSGRTHYGLIAQDLEDLLISLNINPDDFAPLVKVWNDKIVKEQKTIINEDGQEETVTMETQVVDKTQEPTYHVRYEEFIMILVQYCQNLKRKNTDLEDKYNELTSTVNEILKKLN